MQRLIESVEEAGNDTGSRHVLREPAFSLYLDRSGLVALSRQLVGHGHTPHAGLRLQAVHEPPLDRRVGSSNRRP